MTQEIIDMAREAGLLRTGDGFTEPHRWGLSEIKAFAQLVAAREREACAKVCDDIYTGEEARGDWPAPEIDFMWQQALRESIKNDEMYTRYRFAQLVAAYEREACAKVCETEGIGAKYQGDVYAHAIRARGEQA